MDGLEGEAGATLAWVESALGMSTERAAAIATISIGLSLKRIADALDGMTSHAFDEPALRLRK